MANGASTRWKWALGAACALMASAAWAEVAPSLQVLTPSDNWNWDGVMGMQDRATSTLSLSPNFRGIKGTLYGGASYPSWTPDWNTAANIPVIMQNAYAVVSGPDNAVYEIGSTGGLTLNAWFSSGSMTITDLSINFGTKIISATLIGFNGQDKLENVPLWSVDNISSTVVSCPNNGGMCDAGGLSWQKQPQHRLDTISTGLHMTAEGNQAFMQISGGPGEISPIYDFGTYTTSTMFLSGPALHAVPEPANWALMGLGLLGVLGVLGARCDARQPNHNKKQHPPAIV